MQSFPKSALILFILQILLAGCSTAGTTPSPATIGTVAPRVTITEVRQTATEVDLKPAGTIQSATDIPATATVTELKLLNPLLASFGDPVSIGRGGIRDAAFDSGGEWLAIGWTNGISLTRVADQTDLWYWEAPEMVTAVDISAERVAALLVNGDVWLLDLVSGAGQGFPDAAKVPRGNAFWGDVAWSPDGRLVAVQAIGGAGTGATPILLLDPAAGEITELLGSLIDAGWQPYLAWSPDSRLIASANQEGDGWVLDVSSGEMIYKAQGGSSRIITWLPDSSVVITGSGGGDLRLVEVTTGEVLRRLTGMEAGFLTTPPALVSPDGELALVGGYSLGEYRIRPYQVWDLRLGIPVEAPPVGEERHISSAGCMQLNRPAAVFDGDEAITFDTDGRLVRWHVGEEQGEVLGMIPVYYPCLQTPMVWSEDSVRLVLETDPGQALTVWDVPTGALLAERRDGTYPADLHGDVLAYRGADGNLVLWNIAEDKEVGSLPGPVTSFKSGVAFSSDGKQIAYGIGNRLQIADVASGEMVAALDPYPQGQEISNIQWAPDGDALAAASGSTRGFEGPPGVLILWEQVGDAFVEAMRTETVQASGDRPWVQLSQFSPSSRLVGLERMPQPEAGQQAVLVYDRDSRAVIQEKQDYWMHRWLSEELLLLTKGCSFIELDVRTGQEVRGDGEGCQAELGAFAPDGIHFSDLVFSGREVDIMNWRTGFVETTGYIGADVQDGGFSLDGRWLLVRALEGLVRDFPVSYTD